MNLDAAYIGRIVRRTAFDPNNVEKVLRLKELLRELFRHPFLREMLVLKGGTGVNVFLLEIPHLSVDIDLNYVGKVDREGLVAERPEVERAIEQVAVGLGYKIQVGVNDWALKELYLSFRNHERRTDRIQLEINFLMRVCALPPRISEAFQLADEPPCEFPVLAAEELMAGKLKALIERAHPRDFYDLYRFSRTTVRHDRQILRKLTVLFGSTLPRDFRTYTVERYSTLSAADLKRHLYPLLRADDRPTSDEMAVVARPILADVLDHQREQTYLDAIASGQYRPELLFPDHSEIAARIERHPALVWKANNVAQHLSRRQG